VLEELRVEVSKRGRRIGRLGEKRRGNPDAVGEAGVVPSLLDEASTEVELHFHRNQLRDPRRTPMDREHVYVLVVRSRAIAMNVEHVRRIVGGVVGLVDVLQR
jgi:hypothetical protein